MKLRRHNLHETNQKKTERDLLFEAYEAKQNLIFFCWLREKYFTSTYVIMSYGTTKMLTSFKNLAPEIAICERYCIPKCRPFMASILNIRQLAQCTAVTFLCWEWSDADVQNASVLPQEEQFCSVQPIAGASHSSVLCFVERILLFILHFMLLCSSVQWI